MVLLIDTSGTRATVSLAEAAVVLFTEENPRAEDHASWLHPAIQRLLERTGIRMDQLQAIGVVAGPGSYTGLRVGMAAAKGICYALKIPLITLNSLELMAMAMVPHAKQREALICPMLDARRQEVYTAVFSAEMKEILAPQALILDKTSFEQILQKNRVIFSGNGSEKWGKLTASKNALFAPQAIVTESFASLSESYMKEKKWTGLIHAEPFYLKDFHTHSKN